MAKRKPTRDEWRLTGRGWARSLGQRGVRVRLFQKRKNGNFYRAIWISGAGTDEKCLFTSDRREAEKLGLELVARVTLGETGADADVSPFLSVSRVLNRYMTESAAFLDNGELAKSDARTRAGILISFFGQVRDVRNLGADDVTRFTAARLSGGIVYKTEGGNGNKSTAPVRMRSVEADLKLLYAALKWATTVRVGVNGRLLESHPLQGVRRPREQNPKRPIASWDRFVKARKAAKDLASEAESRARAASEAERTSAERMHLRWIRAELALVLLEATGRRSGSIRQLRWEDIHLDQAEIRWRAEADKRRQEWWTPLPAGLLADLKAFKARLGTEGGWLFPADKRPSVPMDRNVFARTILALERRAGLPKLDGGLLHAFRRKWATERKRLPLKDVAAVGGWKDVGTLLACYQQADRETMLAVMDVSAKVSGGSVVEQRKDIRN